MIHNYILSINFTKNNISSTFLQFFPRIQNIFRNMRISLKPEKKYMGKFVGSDIARYKRPRNQIDAAIWANGVQMERKRNVNTEMERKRNVKTA